MPADSGNNSYDGTLERFGSRLWRRRLFWETDPASGIAVINCPFVIDGELYKALAEHYTAGSGDYSAELQDESGIDWLGTLCKGLPLGAAAGVELSAPILLFSAVAVRGLLCYIEKPVFVISHSAGAGTYRGCFSLLQT